MSSAKMLEFCPLAARNPNVWIQYVCMCIRMQVYAVPCEFKLSLFLNLSIKSSTEQYLQTIHTHTHAHISRNPNIWIQYMCTLYTHAHPQACLHTHTYHHTRTHKQQRSPGAVGIKSNHNNNKIHMCLALNKSHICLALGFRV